MREEKNPKVPAARCLLETSFINGPVDFGPALKRAAIERFWLEQMAAAEAEDQK